MFIFCRNIGLSFFNILSVLIDKGLGLGLGARQKKLKEIKWYNSYLTSGCIETRDDNPKILILVGTA